MDDRDTRPSARERGYTTRWDKARAAYLRKHPLCAECQAQGRTVPATVVDHIRPHKGNRKLFWDTANWQPLCRRHHNEKTAREDGAFGNAPKGPAGCDAAGIPRDPAHPWNQEGA